MTSPTDFPRRRTVLSAALASSLAAALPAQAQSASPGAAASPVAGGTLRYGVPLEPTTLVSFLDTKTDNRAISGKITEGLLRYDRDFKPQPLLATAWQVSADGLRYTFTLRQGVKFHDGHDFTSADVRYSLLTQKARGPRGRITLANLAEVLTPDPHTAVLVLARPAPYLLQSLSAAEFPIVPAHVYGDGDPLASPNTTRPIGTGPFVFEQWVRGSHIVLRKNPDYWRAGHPLLDRVVYRILPDRAALSAALEAGEIDAAEGVAVADLQRLQDNPKLAVDDDYDGFLNNAYFLEFNVRTPALARPEVRQAIAHAIDRRFLRDTVYYRRTRIVNSPVPDILRDYYDDSTFRYDFDLARANALLDAAGHPRGADGTRFALRLSFIPGDARRAAAYIRTALSRVGIRVEVVDGDLPAYLARVYQAHDFDINYNGLGRLFDPTVGVQRFFWSEAVHKPIPWVNAAQYENPRVDELFSQAAVETDPGRRAAQFKEIQQIVGRELPSFPLVAAQIIQVRNRRAQGLYNSVDLTAGDFSDAWIAAAAAG
ncbi:MAG: ABC transporter substrate-binding protein [Comamonas sp.]